MLPLTTAATACNLTADLASCLALAGTGAPDSLVERPDHEFVWSLAAALEVHGRHARVLIVLRTEAFSMHDGTHLITESNVQ